MAVTIKDVAAAAGVSPSTVSRTCKDSPSISRDTKERVRRVMASFCPPPSGMSTKTHSIWRSSAASGSSATSGGM